jgi:HipA-like C-terminal domain
MILGPDHQRVLGALAAQGPLTSAELQKISHKSQPSVSRLLAELGGQVLPFGQARATRYGLLKSIHGSNGQQPLFHTTTDGRVERIGSVALLAPEVLHVDGPGAGLSTNGELPWLLAPLLAQGFLGRLLAQRLAAPGVAADPAGWRLETQLFAALHLHDGPGALTLGEPAQATPPALPADAGAEAASLDALAADVAGTLPAGSSAGGEQPKFLAQGPGGEALLVKFTPPRGTPFGERWHDLLHAEHLALHVLAEHGVPVASSRVVGTATRSYFISTRFDRLGPRGRRHVVAIGGVHAGFVPGGYWSWPRTAEALARQRRLPALDAAQVQALWHFGRLIGNTDMHAGNLSLWVAGHSLAELLRGRFTLAPVYDMLPMRWRPDAMLGGAADYSPFEPDALALGSGARGPARDFWVALAGSADVSPSLRDVAGEMAKRLS